MSHLTANEVAAQRTELMFRMETKGKCDYVTSAGELGKGPAILLRAEPLL